MGQLVQRPSSAPRWMNCGGSAGLEAQFPDTQSEIAAEGTAAHWLAEMVMTGQSEIEELTDRKAPNGVFITEDMVEYVSEYIDMLASIQPELKQWVTEETLAVTVHNGDRFEGTPDEVYFNQIDSEIVIADLKYGWGLVDVVENWQLLCYAWLVLCNADRSYDQVRFIIHQPRPHHSDGRIREWVVDRLDLEPYVAQIEQVLASPNDTIKVGKWCRDCAAIGQCPAASEATMAALQIVSDATLEDYTLASLASEMAVLEIASVLIKSRTEAIDALAKEEVKAGKVIPGWALVHGTGRTKWKPGVSTEQLAAAGKMINKPMVKDKPLTPTQAKKAGVPQSLIEQLSYAPQTDAKFERHNPQKLLERMK